ncbi:MAG: biopolymer transporter ExbD [Kofleriaceae bacterium]
MSFTQREARGLIRKSVNRVPEGEEIRHLNIMPMMDMMTILLVAFIFQASVAVSELSTGSVSLPKALSQEPLPEGARMLIIAPNAILVDQQTIVAVSNGDVSASEKEGGATGLKIPKLTNFLGTLRRIEDEARNAQGLPAPDKPELLVVADRSIPYQLLVQVMFSAKQKEAGYKRFRMIVQKQADTP